MNKFLPLIAIISFAQISFADIKDIKLSLDFDAGFIPQAASREYKTPKEDLYRAYNKVFNTAAKLHLEYKFIYGSLSTFAFSSAPHSGTSFKPFRVTWGNEFGVFYGFGCFRISAGWEKNCSHRIIMTNDWDKEPHASDNGYDNIFIRLHYQN